MLLRFASHLILTWADIKHGSKTLMFQNCGACRFWSQAAVSLQHLCDLRFFLFEKSERLKVAGGWPHRRYLSLTPAAASCSVRVAKQSARSWLTAMSINFQSLPALESTGVVAAVGGQSPVYHGRSW